MNSPQTSVAFTGHRTCRHEADAVLRVVIRELYDRGLRTFLSGMAVGFDLAAAEAVLACRESMPGLRLVAVVPFRGQQSRFGVQDRERYARVLGASDEVIYLSERYYERCYAVRNAYLTDHASVLVAWCNGSRSGTQQTVCLARRRGLEVLNLLSGL